MCTNECVPPLCHQPCMRAIEVHTCMYVCVSEKPCTSSSAHCHMCCMQVASVLCVAVGRCACCSVHARHAGLCSWRMPHAGCWRTQRQCTLPRRSCPRPCGRNPSPAHIWGNWHKLRRKGRAPCPQLMC